MVENAIKSHYSKGFTLVELLIALSISSIVMVAMYQTFNSQQKSYMIQEDVASMQQGLRASMFLLTNDIRMAGYDSQLSDNFGITDIRPRDINNNVDTGITGHSCIEVTEDLDDSGTITAGERIQYSVYDFIAGDGNIDIARDSGTGRRLLAENIQGFGLAFAFDDDLDGELDTYTAANPGATQHIIWAIDSDGDNDLDMHLDTDLNGIIDLSDDTSADGMINGVALPSDVSIDNIRAVKIWLLAQTDRTDQSFNNTTTYVVGKYVITPNNNKRMRLLGTTINCRNLGL